MRTRAKVLEYFLVTLLVAGAAYLTVAPIADSVKQSIINSATCVSAPSAETCQPPEYDQ